MQQEGFLLAIAQIAVTLAGFSGLVVAIRSAPPARWHVRDIWSLAWMLGSSLIGLFLALLPPVLAIFRVPDESIWTIATASMSTVMLTFGLAMAVSGHRLTRLGHPARVRYFPGVAAFLLEGVGFLVGLAAVGVLPHTRIGLFAAGLVTCLLVSALSLVVFLVVLARAAGTTS